MLDSKFQFVRRYLVAGLPQGLEASDHHLQYFENFIPQTDLSLRKVRDPESDARLYSFERLTFGAADQPARCHRVGMELTEAEYGEFAELRGRETRFNRYQLKDTNPIITIDVYLGDLWGLNIAAAKLPDEKSFRAYKFPLDYQVEISSDSFFAGRNIVDLAFEDIRKRIS